jgi:transcriptional regulator with XRE-family HTH domain
MEIAKRIRMLRLARSLSPARVAPETHLEPGFLALLEEGKEVPTWADLERLAAAWDVPMSRFFFDDGQPPVTPRLTHRLTLEELERLSPFTSKPG